MKLIIDIDEEMYDWLDNGFPTENDYVKLWEKIRQGTPLPKGHGDLIDRNQILQGEHFMILGNVQVEDENFAEREFDMFPKQTIMSVKPIIEADKKGE